MDFLSILQWLQGTSFATAVREVGVLFPFVEGIHVLTSTFVVGSVAVIDLRLLGVEAFNRSIRQLMNEVLPLTWVGFACAVLTGAAMFSSNAMEYARNGALQTKLLLLGLLAVNMLIFHLVTCRGLSRWDTSMQTPIRARAAGTMSLLLWVSVVVCGRWIGFEAVL